MATDTPIGTRIARRRQVLGLTQQDLAAKLGVSKSTVANWETGKHFPRRYLGKVEDVLGVRLDARPEADPISDSLRAQIHRELGPAAARRVIGVLEGTLNVLPADGQEEEKTQRRDPA